MTRKSRTSSRPGTAAIIVRGSSAVGMSFSEWTATSARPSISAWLHSGNEHPLPAERGEGSRGRVALGGDEYLADPPPVTA